jgi:MFS family permease
MTWLQALVALALFAPGVVAPRAHIEVWQLSMFSCAVFAVGIPASFWGGGFIARMGSLRIASLCAAAIVVSMALASLGSTAALLAAGLCLGLAFGPETPASAAMLSRLVTAERRAFVFSVRQTGNQIGAVCGSLTLPAIAIAFGPAWCYAAVAVTALLAILLFEGLRPIYAGKIVPLPELKPPRATSAGDCG